MLSDNPGSAKSWDTLATFRHHFGERSVAYIGRPKNACLSHKPVTHFALFMGRLRLIAAFYQ
jgi:hypothetical protein